VLKKPYGEFVVDVVGVVHPGMGQERDVKSADSGQAVRELDPARVHGCAGSPDEVLESWSAEAGYLAAIVHFSVLDRVFTLG
jgi:hypothetical protein